MKLRGQRKILLIVALLAFCSWGRGQGPVAGRPWADSLKNFPLLVPASYSTTGLPALRGDYALRQEGFFCRKEWYFQKSTHLPLSFRLGSVEYCDFMEGKPESRKKD